MVANARGSWRYFRCQIHSQHEHSFLWLPFLNVNVIPFAVRKRLSGAYVSIKSTHCSQLSCENEMWRSRIEHCLRNRIKIFRNNTPCQWIYNENRMKEVAHIESMLKKYRPESVGISPTSRKNINILHRFKKHSSKFMVINGRREISLKRGKY